MDKKDIELAIETYYYLVKFWGYENTIGAFLEWRDKYFKNK